MRDHPTTTRPSPKATRRLDLILAALIVLSADVVVKIIVSARLEIGASVELLGSLLRVTPGENTGGAFGVLPGAGPIFAVASIAVIVLLLAVHERSARSSLESVAFGAIIGGALGNLLDRLVDGAVLDYLDLGVDQSRLPLFNLADLAISLGLLVLLTISWRGRRGPSQL